jgi:hypothetical protein
MLMPSWHSLYLSSEASAEILSDWLDAYLTAHGYTRYSPFEAFPGAAYPHAVRTFIAPLASGYLRRLLVEVTSPDDLISLAETLSKNALCLRLSLNGTAGEFSAYAQGEEVEPLPALEPHLRSGQTTGALTGALAGRVTVGTDDNQIGGMNLQELPDRMKSLWNAVNPRQANKMFQNLAQNFVKGEKRAAVQQLLDDAPQWDSAAGKRLRSVMACLNVPAGWREPDFVTLRTAYALHLRRQRLPNAPLFPGDAEAMSAVPDALAYLPVYGGKYGG